MKTLSRLRRAIALHGFSGTASLALRKLRPARRVVADPFDADHGTDTGGVFVPDEGEVVGTNWRHGVQYRAVGSEDFRRSFDAMPRPLSQYTFVDLGSGKGRGLILARELGFARIVGVEYSRGLCEVAHANCQKCGVVAQIIHSDAAQFFFPHGPLVIFMFNPFGGRPMIDLANRLSVAMGSRPLYIVYRNPSQRAVWQGQTWLREIVREECLAVFGTPETSNKNP